MRISVAKEYQTLIDKKQKKEQEIHSLPVGYISKKTIKGNTQYYLQRRNGSKIISSYVRYDELEEISDKIEKRKTITKELARIQELVIPVNDGEKDITDLIRLKKMLTNVA